jgi:hypothetical protein
MASCEKVGRAIGTPAPFRLGASQRDGGRPGVGGRAAVVVALPGVDPDKVEAAIVDGDLEIAGTGVLPRQLQAAVMHRLELPHGCFERRVQLPDGGSQVGAYVRMRPTLNISQCSCSAHASSANASDHIQSRGKVWSMSLTMPFDVDRTRQARNLGAPPVGRCCLALTTVNAGTTQDA